MEIAARVFFGAVIGAVCGLLLSRVNVCSCEACHARANAIVSILGGAVVGAAVGWYFATHPAG